MEDVEVKFMDDIRCVINDSDGNGLQHENVNAAGGSSTDQTIKILLKKVLLLEKQVASFQENQPLLYQVWGKCNILEQRLKSWKKEVDARLNEIGNRPPFPVPQDSYQRCEDSHVQLDDHESCPDSAVSEPEGEEEDYDSDYKSINVNGEVGKYVAAAGTAGTDNVDKIVSTFAASGPPNSYQCKLCSEDPVPGFVDAEELASHYTSQHPAPGLVTSTAGGVITRTRAGRPTGSRSTSANVNGAVRQSDVKRSKEHNCPTCQKVFATPAKMKEHFTSAHPAVFKCNVCGRAFRLKKEVYAHQREIHGKVFYEIIRYTGKDGKLRPPPRLSCPDGCGRTFKWKRNLQIHIPVCRGQKPERCDECDKCFKYPSSLHWHKEKVHRGRGISVCPQCGGNFSSQNMSTHMKTHAKDRPLHYCDICGVGLRSLSRLATHRKLHSGEFPFACPHCDKKFCQKEGWAAHKRIHFHAGKLHQCDECGKTFANQAELKIHKKKKHGCVDS